jgi:hypothetical protein
MTTVRPARRRAPYAAPPSGVAGHRAEHDLREHDEPEAAGDRSLSRAHRWSDGEAEDTQRGERGRGEEAVRAEKHGAEPGDQVVWAEEAEAPADRPAGAARVREAEVDQREQGEGAEEGDPPGVEEATSRIVVAIGERADQPQRGLQAHKQGDRERQARRPRGLGEQRSSEPGDRGGLWGVGVTSRSERVERRDEAEGRRQREGGDRRGGEIEGEARAQAREGGRAAGEAEAEAGGGRRDGQRSFPARAEADVVVQPEARDHQERRPELTHRQAIPVRRRVAAEVPTIADHLELVGKVEVAVEGERARCRVGVVGVADQARAASLSGAGDRKIVGDGGESEGEGEGPRVTSERGRLRSLRGRGWQGALHQTGASALGQDRPPPAEAGELRLHLAVGGVDRQQSAGERVDEAQPGRVQEEARAGELLAEEAVVAAFAVGGVADDRVAEVCTVAAELAPSAGVWPQLEQRVAGARISTDGEGGARPARAAKARCGRFAGGYRRSLRHALVRRSRRVRARNHAPRRGSACRPRARRRRRRACGRPRCCVRARSRRRSGGRGDARGTPKRRSDRAGAGRAPPRCDRRRSQSDVRAALRAWRPRRSARRCRGSAWLP